MTFKITYAPLVAALGMIAAPGLALAQHSEDLAFEYADSRIDVRTTAGNGVALGTFPVGGFFAQYTGSPGFQSEIDADLGIGSGDTIAYNVLDNLLYWDGADFAAPDDGVQIRIDNNGSPNTIVAGDTGEMLGGFGPLVNGIGAANGAGDFHSHVDFSLEPLGGPTPAFGAYGLKLSLTTDAAGVEDSEAFVLLFNFGLASGDFDDAVDAFAGLLGEPLPGDFDGDGNVDSLDYQKWRQDFGDVADPVGTGADGNADGIVNAADYTIWRNNWANAASGGGFGGVSVPEPTAAIFVAAIMSVAAVARRRICWLRTA